MPSILNRLQSGWNAFLGRDPTTIRSREDIGYGLSYRPDKVRLFRTNDRSIISAVICRIGIDAAAVDLKHVRLEEDRYVETINSKLNSAITLDANIDQTGRAFIQDVVMSMCEEGHVVIVPTDTTTNPFTGAYDIEKLRTGRVTEWFPSHVKVDVYNERTGKREEILLPKSMVAIIENPLYSVMNEPNSTLQRLKRALANMDVLDDRNASGKLDLIIQLPYSTRTQIRKDMAEERRKEVEMQLVGSKYGIAYTDVQEKIVQLNRPIDNNYWTQAKELTSMLYNQLGLTENVFNGTADEKAMTNYYNRTIEPILSAIANEMERKFLTKTARSQGQAIRFFRDPFKLVTVETVAEIADKFTRNEIASSNEMRMVIGWKPSKDPRADELRNSNINQGAASLPMSPEGEAKISGQDDQAAQATQAKADTTDPEIQASNENLSSEEIDDLLAMLQNEMDELVKIKENRNE